MNQEIKEEFKKTKKTEEELKERVKFIAWLKSKDLKVRTITNYLDYYDRLFPAINFHQGRVNGFLERYNYNLVATALAKNYKMFILLNKKYFSKRIITQANNVLFSKRTGTKRVKFPKVITESQVLSIEKYFYNERNKIMLLLNFYSGIRLAGLINIRPQSFDWNGWNEEGRNNVGRLKVIEKGDKERVVFIPCSLMKRIESWIKDLIKEDNERFEKDKEKQIHEGASLFRIGASRWRKLLAHASKKALGFSIHPHTLRHSFATHILNKGIKIEKLKELLGHRDISTTMIYTKITQKDIEKDYRDLINF